MRKPALRILRRQEIPRIEERILLSTLWVEASRNEYNYLREHHLRRKRLWHVVRAVWSAHLHDKLANAQDVARSLDIPRSTAMRWLDASVRTGIVGRHGTRYFITEKYLKNVTAGRPSLIDQQIKLILATADALRAMQKNNSPFWAQDDVD